jgi:hypothetical protein
MAILRNLNELTREQLIEQLMAAQKASERKITIKVTAPKADGTGTSGAISIYGLGRFPITLYRSQWERLLGSADVIRAFITANEHMLATKD